MEQLPKHAEARSTRKNRHREHRGHREILFSFICSMGRTWRNPVQSNPGAGFSQASCSGASRSSRALRVATSSSS